MRTEFLKLNNPDSEANRDLFIYHPALKDGAINSVLQNGMSE